MSTIQITDFEQGTFDGSGHEASRNDRIRSTTRFQADTTAFSIKISAVSGKPLKLVLFGWDENNTFRDYLYWYNSGDTIYTSGKSVEYRIAMGYTDDTTISPEDITECSLTVGEWTMNNGTLVPPLSDSRPATAEYAMSPPYPKSHWHIDKIISPIMPYHELLLHTIPKNYVAVPQNEYICVYDYKTKQWEFDTHGLAVLTPTSCKVTEQINGAWSVTLEHPIDKENRWKYILEFNILKVQGQLFTIKRVEHYWNGHSGGLTAYAEHIFYQLNDRIIFPGNWIAGVNGYELMRNSLWTAYAHYEATQTVYEYTWNSDISYATIGEKMAVGTVKWVPTTKEMTPIEWLLGSDGFISTFGGELYRDNFYYSVGVRMENAQENAFEIRVGLNLQGIRRTVDLSSLCTYFKGEDNHGNGLAVAWSAPSWQGLRGFPHHICRYKKFSYQNSNWQVFSNDVMTYFYNNCKPIVSYSISLKDVRRNPDYKEFTPYRYKVGDTGKIYDERLGINQTMEVTKTVTDGITGEILEVCFGNQLSFVNAHNYYNYETAEEFIPEFQSGELQLLDKNDVQLYDKNGVKLVNEVTM